VTVFKKTTLKRTDRKHIAHEMPMPLMASFIKPSPGKLQGRGLEVPAFSSLQRNLIEDPQI